MSNSGRESGADADSDAGVDAGVGSEALGAGAGTGTEARTDVDDGEADVDEEAAEPEGTPGYLPTLPDTFVTLGAGCLATAGLLTALAFGFVLWMIATGNTQGLAGYEVALAALQMGFATVLLAGGAYSALKRVRWTLAMLAAILGSFAVITIPFTAVAAFCIGLGKYHFSANLMEME